MLLRIGSQKPRLSKACLRNPVLSLAGKGLQLRSAGPRRGELGVLMTAAGSEDDQVPFAEDV